MALRIAVWAWLIGLGLLFAGASALEAGLTQAWGPNPIKHITASPWLWGVGPHTGLGWAPLTLAALGAGLGWVAARAGVGPRWHAWAGQHRAALMLGFPVLMAGLFWYARVALSQGDWFKYLIMLRDDKWFVMSQPLSTAAFSFGYAVLGPLGWPPAAAAAAVNAVAGAVWVAALLGLSAATGSLPLRWVGAGLAGGAVVFFGYLETMAWPLALAALYLLAAQRALAGGPAWPAAVLFGLTVTAHGQMLLLGPSLLVVAALVWRRRGAWPALALGPLAAAPLALIIGFALLNQHRIYDTLVGDALGGADQRMFVPLHTLGSVTERYTLFSWSHLWEMANLVLRSSLWLPLLVVGAGVGWRRGWREPASGFWALVLAGGLSFVPLWNADFGMDVDWDLYAPPLMLALLAGSRLWPSDWRLPPLDVGAAAGLSLGATVVSLATFTPTLAWDPWNVEAVTTAPPVYARVGEVAELVAAQAPSASVRAGQTWMATTVWRLRRPVTVQYTSAVYVIALEPAGPRLIAQHDGRPVAPIDWPNPRYTDEWIVGELVPDTHPITIPAETAPGAYQVWAVLYDLASGQRLPVGDTDHVVIATLVVSNE